MNARVKILKQLVADGHYLVDEIAVAEAVLLRAAAREVLPDVTFRGGSKCAPPVRSFRPHRGAPSFRLTQARRRPPLSSRRVLPLSF